MAGRVLLKIAYLLVRRILGLSVLVFRGDRAKDAELLILRHENAVLRRHAGRMRYEPCRPGLVHRAHAVHPAAALGQGFPVTPATLLALCVPTILSTALASRVAVPGCCRDGHWSGACGSCSS